MRKKIRLFSLIALLALVVAACGGDSGETTDTTVETEVTTTVATEEDGAMEADSIVDIVVSNEDFSTLAAAVEAAGLVDALADPSAELTVFAPDNDAFDAALESLGMTAEELLADVDTLTSILTFHVLGEIVTSGDIGAAGTEEIPVDTLSGEELVVVVGDDGSVGFKDQAATVEMADVEASNGVIHVIGDVLLPPEA